MSLHIFWRYLSILAEIDSKTYNANYLIIILIEQKAMTFDPDFERERKEKRRMK